MNYILKICTRYLNPEANTSKSWAFKEYNEACKKMIEGLESLQRLIMARINYDLAL